MNRLGQTGNNRQRIENCKNVIGPMAIGQYPWGRCGCDCHTASHNVCSTTEHMFCRRTSVRFCDNLIVAKSDNHCAALFHVTLS
jgi:hypothetical protein